MRIARGIFSRYNNLIFAVLEVWWRAYYNSALNFEEVFAFRFDVLSFARWRHRDRCIATFLLIGLPYVIHLVNYTMQVSMHANGQVTVMTLLAIKFAVTSASLRV